MVWLVAFRSARERLQQPHNARESIQQRCPARPLSRSERRPHGTTASLQRCRKDSLPHTDTIESRQTERVLDHVHRRLRLGSAALCVARVLDWTQRGGDVVDAPSSFGECSLSGWGRRAELDGGSSGFDACRKRGQALRKFEIGRSRASAHGDD